MADHEHGSMDITEHEKTFEGFVKRSVRVAIGSLIALIYLAIFWS